MSNYKGGPGGARPNSGPDPKPRAAIVSVEPQLWGEKQTVADLARQYTHFAVQTLALIAATGANEAARVSALKTILEFGHGKPAQQGAAGKGEQEVDDAPGGRQAAEWGAILNS